MDPLTPEQAEQRRGNAEGAAATTSDASKAMPAALPLAESAERFWRTVLDVSRIVGIQQEIRGAKLCEVPAAEGRPIR